MERTKYQHQAIENEPALLWEDICDETQVDRFYLKIVPREKTVLFGYADVTIVVKTASGVKFPVKLRGIVVKSLKGQPHIDMPAEKGSDGEWYDQFMPRSPAARTVLTTFIFSDPEVQAAVAAAAAARVEGASADDLDEIGTTGAPTERPPLTLRADNPFAKQATA